MVPAAVAATDAGAPARPAAAGRTRRCRGRTSGASVTGRAISSAAPRAATWTRVLRRGRKPRARRGRRLRRGSRSAAAPGRHLAPDAERGVAVGLIARSCGRRTCAARDRLPATASPRRRRPRRPRRRASGWAEGEGVLRARCSFSDTLPLRIRFAAGVRGVGQQHRGEQRRGELREGRQGRHGAAGCGPRRGPAASPPGAERRACRWSSTPGRRRCRGRRPSRRRGSRRACGRRGRGGCGCRAGSGGRRWRGRRVTAAPWAAGRSSQLPDQGQIRSKGT